MYADHMEASGWTLSIFGSLLSVVLVVLAIIWLVRTQSARASTRRRDEGGSPREPLDRRLVSGEIDEDEYQRLDKTISEAPKRADLQTIRCTRTLRPTGRP